MMKKSIVVALLVLLLAALAAAPALAKPGAGNVKGKVMAVGAGTLTIQTSRGETVTVVFPTGFDLTTFTVGDWVMVKGSLQPDVVLATWVKEIGPRGEDDDPDDEEGAGRMNGAYCSGAKPLKPHPVAFKLAESYDVSQDWVMGYFCSGQGMGAIMLALKMAEAYDAGADALLAQRADALLAQRAGGMGWGQIWKEKGWIGNERDGESPPGWLKKLDHAGPKNNK